MIKKLIDILLMRKLDSYLLKNYPAIWQTKGHYVLIYSLLIGLVLFLFGYFITSTNNLTVPPIQQLFLNNDNGFLIAFAVAILFILYWIFTQYKTQKRPINFLTFLLSLLIYLMCTSSILLLDTTAYRLGTISKCKGLMTKEDIDTLKANYFYMYGYVRPHERYSIKEIDFEAGYKRFKKLVLMEDDLLIFRYNLDSLSNQLYGANLLSNLLDRSNLSYQSEVSDLSNLSNFVYRYYRSALLFRSYQLDLSYQSYQSDLSYRSYLSYFSDRVVFVQ